MKSAHRPILPAPPGIYRLSVAALADPRAPDAPARPADLLVELGPADDALPISPRALRILASGSPRQIDAHPAAASAAAVDLRHAAVLPGMVNAHTHLDLTHIGPQPHDPGEGFVAWVDRIRAARLDDPGAIRDSVARGVALSLRAGVAAVGDIAGAPKGQPRLEPFQALADSPLAGVSFIEFFAMGSAEAPALERLEAFLAEACRLHSGAAGAGPHAAARARLGLQPHATNTVSLPAYRRAVHLARERGLPLATHLAETPEERQFIAEGAGPQRAFLERFGFWQDAILEYIGRGLSPVEHLAPVLAERPFLVAHVNDPGPDPARTIETLASTGASVAYCPRASDYFQAHTHFGPHRYRDMLAAGVNVCLGTDSIVNLPRNTDAPDGPGLSVLDEARFLHARDQTDPATLLGMITVNACRALGLPDEACSLADNASPLALAAADVSDTPPDRPAAERILRSRHHARLLAIADIR